MTPPGQRERISLHSQGALITDKELIARVLSGERDAYAELVRRHHANVMGLCVSMLHDSASAEDAAQEVFLKAYRSLEDFGQASSFSTWLYRIASNQCLDMLRKTARKRAESLDALLETEEGEVQRLIAEGPDPTRALEDADLVERVLAELSPEYRLILTLREVQGLSYEEIAEGMDCSLDSVKARLRRAREQFEAIVRHFESSRNVQ